MVKWYYTDNKGKLSEDDKGKLSKEEKFLRRMVCKLNRYAKRHGIRYADVYVIESDGTRTVNIRAKRGESVIVSSYAFI